VAVIPDASGHGYWIATNNGNVYSFGDAPYLGAPGIQSSPVTSAVRTPDGQGYWILRLMEPFTTTATPNTSAVRPALEASIRPPRSMPPLMVVATGWRRQVVPSTLRGRTQRWRAGCLPSERSDRCCYGLVTVPRHTDRTILSVGGAELR